MFEKQEDYEAFERVLKLAQERVAFPIFAAKEKTPDPSLTPFLALLRMPHVSRERHSRNVSRVNACLRN